jgi:hypothetical protein
MSDLKKYIAKRKKTDKEFAECFEEGYEQFKIGVVITPDKAPPADPEASRTISQQIKLDAHSDCALVYNPMVSMKNPKLVLYIPSLHESGGDLSPHSVMMAVIANMILDKDPEFEALISKKVSHYIETFEKENVV